MRYLQEVEIAEFCPISEAADWLAFGFLPSAVYDLDRDDRPIEQRQSVDSILEYMGHHFSHDLYLGEAYINERFTDVDASAYISAYEQCGGENPSTFKQSILEKKEKLQTLMEGNEDPEHVAVMKNLYEDWIASDEANLEAAESLRLLQVPILHALNAARAKLFLSLIDGRLTGKGVCMPADDEVIENWGADDWPKDFISIPKTSWDMRCVNWHDSNLELWDEKYLGVIIPTEKLLEIFPNPDLLPEHIEGNFFGKVFISEQVDTNINSGKSGTLNSRNRGAPHSTDRILEAAIHKHLDSIRDSGTFPKKREALVAEVSDFVFQTLNQEMKRTTAQRIIQRWLPKNPAHNF
ncbi:MAG: hypothetical protein JJU08_03810 [Rhodobacteraceae bacterium]|nr:hypothetical protein [Paracoccaceae bacterium]